MKNLLLLLSIFFFISCTPVGETVEEIPLTETDVRLEFYTQESNYDEIEFSYYDNKTDKFNNETLVFNYDNSGNPLPLIVNWEDFGYKYVRGEAYRNNFSIAELTLKLYVNDELVYEETQAGNSNAYARVVFDHTIN
uniref:hypothetical protein n=1 Tax=uncultured Polaribacter sp. TaxID=174711 RepID=UPI00261A972F|nr:hypothetical protein [uncultured Polaribacter sp.]